LKVCQNDPFYATLGRIFNHCMTSCVTWVSNIKIDLNKIFNKKDEDIGKDIYLTLRVNYSFDKGEVITQEDKYLVSVIKTSPVKTDLAYRLCVLKERFLRRRWHKND